MNPLLAASGAPRASFPVRPDIEGRAGADVAGAGTAGLAVLWDRYTPISTTPIPGWNLLEVSAALVRRAALAPGTSC